jgi:hypothetical protein
MPKKYWCKPWQNIWNMGPKKKNEKPGQHSRANRFTNSNAVLVDPEKKRRLLLVRRLHVNCIVKQSITGILILL